MSKRIITIELSDFHYELLKAVCEYFPEYADLNECFENVYLPRLERMIESDIISLMALRKKIERIFKEVVDKK